MPRRKISIRNARIMATGHLAYEVWVDERRRGYGDLFCKDEGDLVEDDGLPSVGGSPDWVEDDEISDDVRAAAIAKARELGMTWPTKVPSCTWYITKPGHDLELKQLLDADDENVVAEFVAYTPEEAHKYFEGFNDGWTALRATFRMLLGVEP